MTGREVRRAVRQEAELGVFFDTIVVCSVTGSTQAGMIAGFAAQERERRVLGIDGSAKPAETRDQVARIARGTAELIGLGRDLRDDEILLDERFHAGTYGIPDERTVEAIGSATESSGSRSAMRSASSVACGLRSAMGRVYPEAARR